MNVTIDPVSVALLSWAGAVASTSVFALLRGAPALRPAAIDPRARDVLLVRPCSGAEPHLGLSLASTGRLADAEGLAIVFAVPSASDTAFPIATEIAAELSGRGIDASVEITTRAGPNNKAAQLELFAHRHLDRSLLVVVDSDVDLGGVSLGALVQPLRDRGEVACVWAPPVEAPLAPTFGDRLSAAVLGSSLHAFPMLARIDRSGMVGKCFAVRRSALSEVGGFASLRQVLGEDVMLAEHLAGRGYRIEAAPFVVRSLASGRSVGAVVARFGRWITVVRAQRAALLVSYPILFAATLPLLAAACAHGLPTLSAIAAVVTLAARFAVARVAARVSGLGPVSIPMMLATDLVLLAALMRALATRKVRWRDRELVIEGRGVLVETRRLSA